MLLTKRGQVNELAVNTLLTNKLLSGKYKHLKYQINLEKFFCIPNINNLFHKKY